MSEQLIEYADCFEFLKRLPNGCVDACVTDPPYELGFMGKSWDSTGIAYRVDMWQEVLRVMSPGAHLLSFGGTRTYHRMGCAIEDAGFEIRDSLHWLYGTGFPKSLDISKVLDKAAPPKTDAAKQWSGWGTALKPGHEPIILARKPVEGTVAENILAYGTGGLNIDACRIETTDNLNGGAYAKSGTERHDGSDNWRYKRTRGRDSLVGDTREGAAQGMFQPSKTTGADFVQPSGRWPANVILDEDAGAELDEQSGTTKSGIAVQRNGGGQKIGTGRAYHGSVGLTRPDAGYPDTGGASRFFYCAKASRVERDAGCETLIHHTGGELTGGRKEGSAGLASARAGAGRTSGGKNTHPTVKPISLMRWLVRLIAVPRGLVIDPFVGSGTTALACFQEGFDFMGCDNDAKSVLIADHRIKYWRDQGVM